MVESYPSRGLVDTDILVDVARGLESSLQFLSEWSRASVVYVSVITAMELVAGCRDSAQLKHTQYLISKVMILPLTDSSSLNALQLMKTYTLSHGLLLADALIAACCIEHNLTLITRNLKHFRMIPQLTVYKPYE